MTTLPLFPLNIVSFPDEDVNLHIFEPRYKQLINECWEENKTFGLSAFIDNKVMPIGTEMKVIQIASTSPTGEMDIKTKGLRTFKIIDFYKELPDKLYAGAKVDFLTLENNADSQLHQQIKDYLKELFTQLGVAKEIRYNNTLDMAHYIGLTIQEEYDILSKDNEKDQQLLILAHLQRLIPVVTRARKIKEKLKMNGHFKNFDKLDF